jgi:hypothetical protein
MKTDYNIPKEEFPITGLWLHNSGIQNTRVSAVLILKDLDHSKIAKTEPTLWHNPWAQFPISSSDWKGKQIIYNISLAEKETIDTRTRINELFNLDENWPE